MQRSFSITFPDNTGYHNLYSLLVGTAVYGAVHGGTDETAVTGAIPTDGVLPDRVSLLDLTTIAAVTVTVADRNKANTAGRTIPASTNMQVRSDRNTICLKDYFLKASATTSNGLGVTIEVI